MARSCLASWRLRPHLQEVLNDQRDAGSRLPGVTSKAFSGEMIEAVQLLDPAVTYHLVGSSRLAGDFQGPQAVAQHVEEFLRLTNRTVDLLKWEDWLVRVDHVGLVMQLRYQRRGMVETQRFIWLVSPTDQNKIRRIDVFFSDGDSFERFFPPLQP